MVLVVTTHLELLLKLVSGIANAFTSGLDVVDADADVSEAFAVVFVAIGNLEVRVTLRAVVVGQLDEAFAVCPVVVVGDGLGRVYGLAAANRAVSLLVLCDQECRGLRTYHMPDSTSQICCRETPSC